MVKIKTNIRRRCFQSIRKETEGVLKIIKDSHEDIRSQKMIKTSLEERRRKTKSEAKKIISSGPARNNVRKMQKLNE